MCVEKLESPYQRQVGENAEADGRFVAGMYGAGLYVGLAILPTLPIMWVFGEGDYILLIIAIIYAALFVFGIEKRRRAAAQSIQRSLGIWIAIYSAMMCIGCLALALIFFFSGR